MTSPAEIADTHPEDDGSAHRAASESARLRSELTQAEARAERAERAIERMERSAKYTVGSLLVDAARSPRKLLLLPRDLWRVWRLRGSRRAAPRATTRPRARRDDILDLDAARLLLPRASTRPEAALSIVGALSETTAAAWGASVAVSAVLPHEASEVAMALDADIVVIESAAALPGQPWAFLGDPAGADRDRAASRLIDAARQWGRPVVLLRNTPPAHTAFLGALERQCDLVVDGPGSRPDDPWHPGIGLGPIPAAGDPSTAAVLGPLGSLPSARARSEALREALSAAGIALLVPDPRLPAPGARSRALAGAAFGIASPLVTPSGTLGASCSSLEVLAAGRRLISGPDPELARILAGAESCVSTLEATGDADAAVAAGRTPLPDRALREMLRSLLMRVSVPVQLQALADRLAIASRPLACWDISLVSHDADVDAVLLQSWRPREIVVQAQPSDRARQALEDEGIRVVVVSPMPLTRDDIALACSSPLIATQIDLSDRHAVADLLVEHVTTLAPRPRPTDAALWRAT